MNKNEFMESLKAKLAGLNPEDREDAINYYWEYFEEAGFGEESDVTKSVGNPEDVAAKIIGASAYVNETRAEDNSTETKEEVCNTHAPCNDSEDNNASNTGNDSVETEKYSDKASEDDRKAICECTALELYKDITPDAFDSIDIDVSSLDIIIRTGDEFGIYVNCKENEPVIKKEGNRLVIRDKRKSKIFDFNFNMLRINLSLSFRLKSFKRKFYRFFYNSFFLISF